MMNFLNHIAITILVFTIEILRGLSAPITIKDKRLKGNTPEELYLVEYGYLPPNFDHADENWKEEFEWALAVFQSFASIPVSGKMDNETSKVMHLSRCGNADFDPNDIFHVMQHESDGEKSSVDKTQGSSKLTDSNSRNKRYVLESSRWRSRDLYYNISKYPSKSLSEAEVEREIRDSFSVWEEPTHLTFHKADENSSKVHIDIRFESLEHGDGDDFDGRGSITAHAFFPRSINKGQIHFDDDEEWTVDSTWGTNLFQVATHEIGHSLGLSHSNVHDSVMSPIYTNFKPHFQLHEDDIEGIQALYGKKSTILCDDPSIDAITTMADGFTYIFKGPYVYQMDFQLAKISTGYPKAISFEFPNLPEGRIDAAFTRTNNITYFFKGDKLWRFSNMKMDSGFPKNISDFFEGIPSDLNAATTLSVDDKIYFFKGAEYWKYDHTQTPPVSSYPKPLSDWKGIPEKGIDAAFRSVDSLHGISTIFFRNHQYWRFNDQAFTVDLADPPYPRNPSLWLYGCNSISVDHL